MRGVRGRAAGPAHDAEGSRGDEQPRGGSERDDPQTAGLRERQAACVQISARGDLHRRAAEDGHGEDRPAGAVEDVRKDVATLSLSSRRRPGPIRRVRVIARAGHHLSSPNPTRWLWVPAFAGTTAVFDAPTLTPPSPDAPARPPPGAAPATPRC